MEFEVDGAAGDRVAVTHDGPHLRSGVVGAAPFRRIAIVDRTAGPTAPVRVVGTEVVAQLVRDHIQVPAVIVQVVGGGRA